MKDARRIAGEDDPWVPRSTDDLVGRIFHTCFMGTQNSSLETRQRAIDLSGALGAYHVDLNMDSVVKSVVDLFGFVTGRKPQYRVRGGNKAENLALQNIQVRRYVVLRWKFEI